MSNIENDKLLPLDSSNNKYLIAIWERSVRSTHNFLEEKDLLYYKSRLSIYLNNLDLYGIINNNIIKGFIGVSKDKIEMLFVDSVYFSTGIGSKLLLFAINELGIKKIDVNEQNVKALHFYMKFGFSVIGYSNLDAESKNYPILNLELI